MIEFQVEHLTVEREPVVACERRCLGRPSIIARCADERHDHEGCGGGDEHYAHNRKENVRAHRPYSLRKRWNSSTTAVSTVAAGAAAGALRRHVASSRTTTDTPSASAISGPIQ